MRYPLPCLFQALASVDLDPQVASALKSAIMDANTFQDPEVHTHGVPEGMCLAGYRHWLCAVCRAVVEDILLGGSQHSATADLIAAALTPQVHAAIEDVRGDISRISKYRCELCSVVLLGQAGRGWCKSHHH